MDEEKKEHFEMHVRNARLSTRFALVFTSTGLFSLFMPWESKYMMVAFAVSQAAAFLFFMVALKHHLSLLGHAKQDMEDSMDELLGGVADKVREVLKAEDDK